MTTTLSTSLNFSDIILFTPEHLIAAETFAKGLLDDRNFTHFRHTQPINMLSGKWEVYLISDGKYNDPAGNRVIAWGQIEKFPYSPSKFHTCRLGFVVLPEFRKRGIGGKMMDYVMSKCQRFDKLVATVYADNAVMLTMFLRRGFVIEGFFNNEESFDNQPRHVISLAKFSPDSMHRVAGVQ